MSEKVEIQGGNLDGSVLNNAASEATLLRLTAAIEKMAGAKGKTGQGNSVANLKKLAEAQEKNIKGLVESSDSLQKVSTKSNVLGQSFEKLGKVAGLMSNTLGILTGSLLYSSGKLSELANLIPVVGGTLSTLVGFVESNINQYRTLSSHGASFGNSIFEMRSAAANAAMFLDDFAKCITENSKLMAVFGESTSAGAARFAEVSGKLRTGQLGMQLQAMGFTMEDVNSSLLSYMEIQSRNGQLEKMSNSQLIQQSAEYALEMDRLAKMTGIQRKELEKSVQKNQEDIKMRMYRGKLEGDALKNFDSSWAMIDSRVPGLSEALRDLADGTAQSSAAIAIAGTTAGPALTELAQKMAKGALTPEQLNNELIKIRPLINEFARSIDGGSGAVFDALQKSHPELARFLSSSHELNRLTKKDIEQLKQEQERKEKITAAFSQFEQLFKKVKTQIEDAILNSPVFTRLRNMIADFISGSEGPIKNFVDQIPGYVERFLTSIENFIKKFEEPGATIGSVLGKYAKDIMGEIGTALLSGIGNAIVGIGNAITDGIINLWKSDKIGSSITDGIKYLWENPRVVSGLLMSIAAFWAAAKAKSLISSALTSKQAAAPSQAAAASQALDKPGFLKTPEDKIRERAQRMAAEGAAEKKSSSRLGRGVKAVGSGLMQGVKAVGSGLMQGVKAVGSGLGLGIKAVGSGLSAFANPATLIGLAAVTAAVYVLAHSIKVAGPHLESFGKMLESMGKSISDIFDAINPIIRTTGEAIIGIINSIGNSIGDIIGKITEFRTAGINATTEQITKLSQIPADNMLKAAQGIAAMKEALDGFSPGLLSSIGQGIGAMFTTDQSEKIAKLSEAGKGLQPIGGYIESINGQLTKFNDIKLEGIDNAAIKFKALAYQVADTAKSFKNLQGIAFEEISDKISKLVESLKEVGKSISNIGSDKSTDGKTQSQLLTDIGSKIDYLNGLTAQLVQHSGTSAKSNKRVAENTKYASGSVL